MDILVVFSDPPKAPNRVFDGAEHRHGLKLADDGITITDQTECLAECVSRLFKLPVTCRVVSEVFLQRTTVKQLEQPHAGKPLGSLGYNRFDWVCVQQCGCQNPGLSTGLKIC